MDTDMKTSFKIALMGIFALLLVVQGCKPFEEEGIDLPGAPTATISWEFIDAIDSTGQVVGTDSNRVFVSAEAVEGAFFAALGFWKWSNVGPIVRHNLLPS
jgi:hypothetical protein